MSGGWMEHMSPQQRQQQQQQQRQQSPDSGGGRRGRGQTFTKHRQRSQSFRRQSAPSLSISRALTRSKTLSRESLPLPNFNPEKSPLVQSFLINSDRNFLLHGHVQLKTGMQTQDRHLFLFTDILVIGKAKSANHFKQKARVRVCELWTAGCMDEVCEGSTSVEQSFVIGWPTCNYVATFSSTEQKEKWLSQLKNVTKTEKETEEPKTIALRVHGKGINTFAQSKTLPVSNWDSTNEVIRLALQQFGIIGNIKDFQLWVASKRDNMPYPLIGHEFPFSIHMNHVRHAAFQRRDASLAPADRKVALQGELPQVSKQCQFILRPRPTETPPLSAAVMPEKTLKRRNSLISWAFWRGSAPQLNEPALSVATGCLFGQPLSTVCLEGALPKPVMDMLSFLYKEGTWTQNILRKSARFRAIRDLRDSLDSGNFELPLAREHVHLIAGVFKEFLRNIPGSLLCCELYQEWLEALEDEDEEEEQVQDVKRMLSRLPKENVLLLRHLLALMHAFQSNAQENHMTSLNLGVCISASMLWQPGPPSSPERHGAHSVCRLVTFMIDHCQEILEQEPSSLFGGPPRRPDTAEVETDFWLYPQTDSSYDSLENELDGLAGSPGFTRQRQCQTRPEQLSGSLDSVLTFSDTDPDTGGVKRRLRRLNPEKEVEGEGEKTLGALDSLSLDDKQRRRRSSEPAPLSEGNHVVGVEGEGSQHLLEVKTSSSTPASPELSCTSPDSPEPRHFLTRRGRRLHSKASVGEALLRGACLRSPPPRDAVSLGGLSGYRSLHPNSWLKKERKLSLTQQDHLKKDTTRKSAAVGKVVPADSSQQPPHLKGSPPSPARPPFDYGGEAKRVKQRSPSLFYKHGALTLSLFKPGRAEEVQRSARLYQRRVSEPGHQVVEQASTFSRSRLPSDPGLKVSQVDSQGAKSVADSVETRFCLSPYATSAVRDYFCSHPYSNPHSGQQVALALVESHREWLKRCSGPGGEPDLDHVLFSEESFV